MGCIGRGLIKIINFSWKNIADEFLNRLLGVEKFKKLQKEKLRWIE